MISSVNSYSAKTHSRQNQKQKIANTPQRQNNSPSFKGAGSDFAVYFAADFTAIVAACGLVDYYFKKVSANQAKRFAQLTLKKMKNTPELQKISELSGHISRELQQDPKTRKIGKSFQAKYESIFQQPLKTNHSKEKIQGTVQENLESLQNKVEDFVINLDKAEVFNGIGDPFLKTIRKTSEALTHYQISTKKAASKKEVLSGRVQTIRQGFQAPTSPKSLHH